MEHELKVWPEYWDVLVSGEKSFEVRRDDRGFQKGDVLILRRTHAGSARVDTTFPALRRRVAWILTGGQFGIEAGYVVMAVVPEARA